MPLLGVSRQPIRFISVDLPEPGRPHDGHVLAALDLNRTRRAGRGSPPRPSRRSSRDRRFRSVPWPDTTARPVPDVADSNARVPRFPARLRDPRYPGPPSAFADDRRIGQRRRVAQRLALGDVAQQPSHDLARPGLRQIGGEKDVVGACNRADLLDDVLLELVDAALRATASCRLPSASRTPRSPGP